MRRASKTDSGSCLLPVLPSTSLRPHFHDTAACHHVHGPPIKMGTVLPTRLLSRQLDPIIPSIQPTRWRHAAPRRCNSLPLLSLVSYSLTATSVYKAPSLILCQWGSLWIHRLCLLPFLCLPRLNPALALSRSLPSKHSSHAAISSLRCLPVPNCWETMCGEIWVQCGAVNVWHMRARSREE